MAGHLLECTKYRCLQLLLTTTAGMFVLFCFGIASDRYTNQPETSSLYNLNEITLRRFDKRNETFYEKNDELVEATSSSRDQDDRTEIPSRSDETFKPKSANTDSEGNEAVQLIKESTTTQPLPSLTTRASKTLPRNNTELNELRKNGSKVADDQGKGSAKNTKLIIFWSKRPEKDNECWWDKAKSGKQEFQNCEWSDCELSRDRRRVREATIIVFRHHDPYPEWPEVRFPNQTYIHVLNERPNPGHWWLAKFDDRINITWNYRRNADVSYHKIVVEKENPSNETYVPRVPFAEKTKSVVWAVSHCKTPSKRDVYAKEMAKYIDVDIYGYCGTMSCPKADAKRCTEMWARTYKFHLSFENTICQDYITEKFYRPLQNDMIPIVLGGGDYKTVGPPHSYIDVRDYKSPKELATYLKYLAKNEEKYNEYFQWKQKYVMQENFRRLCKMCEIAHNMEKWARPVYHDYYNWWMKGCDAELMDRMREEGNW